MNYIFDFVSQKSDPTPGMRAFLSTIILSMYAAGALINAGGTTVIEITHSHPVAIEHSHHHEDHHAPHDSQDAGVPHSHCITVLGSAVYCMSQASVAYLPNQDLAEISFGWSNSHPPEEPALSSIFRPPIA